MPTSATLAAEVSVAPSFAMLAAEGDPASVLIQHLLGLPHAQRQKVTSVSIHELLEDVAQLKGCARCGFVPRILAALLPEIQYTANQNQAALGPSLTPSLADTWPLVNPHHHHNSANQGAANPTSHNHCLIDSSSMRSSDAVGPGGGSLCRHQDHHVQSHHHHMRSSGSTLRELQSFGCPPLAAPSYSVMQLRPLLNMRKGVLSLTQFVWGQDQANGAGKAPGINTAQQQQQQQQQQQICPLHELSRPHHLHQHCGPDRNPANPPAWFTEGGAASAHSNTICLADSLLMDDKLLARFMSEGLAHLQADEEAGGNSCVDHKGCPGPIELAATETRLLEQKQRVLQQLEALESLALHEVLHEESSRRNRRGRAREATDSARPISPEDGAQHDASEEASAAAAAAERAAARVTHQVLAPSLSDPILLQPPTPQASHASGHLELSTADPSLPASATAPHHSHTLFLTSHHNQNPSTNTPSQPAPTPSHHSRTSSYTSQHNHNPSSGVSEHAAAQRTTLHCLTRSQPAELFCRRGLTPLAQRAASRDASRLQADGSMAQGSGSQPRTEQLQENLRQIEQRLKRLNRAREHGLEAGGRRLLSLVLSRCWLSLIRDAFAAQAPNLLHSLVKSSPASTHQNSLPAGAHTDALIASGVDASHSRSSLVHQNQGMHEDADISQAGVQGACALEPAGRSSGPAHRSSGPAHRSNGTADRSNGPAGESNGPADRSNRPPGRSSGLADRSLRAFGSEQMKNTDHAAASMIARLLMHAGFPEAWGQEPAEQAPHACSPDKKQGAAHAELQAAHQQLSLLSHRLADCQAAQASMQLELSAAVDQAEAAQGEADETNQHLRLCLSQWQGDSDTLKGMLPEELAELAGQMQAALSRVHAHQAQASAEQELLCPCCWERRKDLVFACGHQCCCLCGERLTACPICRATIDRARSIRTFI